MSVEEVIRLGEIAGQSQYTFWMGSWWWFLIAVVSITIMTIGVMSYDGDLSIGGLCLFIIWILLHLIFTGVSGSDERIKNIKEWENSIVNPYIESLEVSKNEIVYIKIDPELSNNVKGSLFYTYSTPVMLTPLAVSFKGNGLETYVNWYETKMELTDEEKPYIEYQRLEGNLGNGVEKGIYNAKVYLPESYEFTDIK